MPLTARMVRCCLSLGGLFVALPGLAQPGFGRYSCPAELQPLTEVLVRDLPGYVNRVSQRSRRRGRNPDLATYMSFAGRPEFEPLPLTLGGAQPADAGNLEQVFLTTLERQYVGDRIVEIQTFHWIFLTQTQQGRRLATMFSRVGGYPATRPPSPPEETSEGIVAQAIQTWLRDCQAGSIRPLKPR